MHSVKPKNYYPYDSIFRILILKLLDREREDKTFLNEW